jgi:hypothetical protein
VPEVQGKRERKGTLASTDIGRFTSNSAGGAQRIEREEEMLDHVIVGGEAQLQYPTGQSNVHFIELRPHQSLAMNRPMPILPRPRRRTGGGSVRARNPVARRPTPSADRETVPGRLGQAT